MRNRCLFLFAVLSFFLMSSLSHARANQVVYELKDRSKCYFGNADVIKLPAIVDAKRVFEEIPSYKEALKHPEGCAKRMHGLKKASDEFKDILAKVCKDKNFEFVAETGFLTATDSKTKKSVVLTDITTDAIAAISK